MAKVSICIPTYNNVKEVERLLNSIISQSYKDYEVNISDDSTNEEIAMLAKKYSDIFEKSQVIFRYIHNEKPLGHIFNWNAAIDMSKGEYIKIMFSDDWFTFADSLSEFVKLLDETPQADIAFSGSRQVMLSDEGSNEAQQDSYDRCADEEFLDAMKKDYRRLFRGNQIGAPSAVIYRRTSPVVRFDEKSNWASDMFLYFDLLIHNADFAYSKAPLVSIGVHEHQYTESFSEHDMRIYNDYRYLYTKYHLETSEACKEYFLKKFIVKYRTGRKEAKALGISSRDYVLACMREFQDSCRCFIRSRMKK